MFGANGEKLSGHHLGGRFGGLKADHPLTVGLLEDLIHLVLRVHAQRMIEGVEVFPHRLLYDLEIADHARCIQLFRFEHKFNFASVTVGEFTFVRMQG